MIWIVKGIVSACIFIFLDKTELFKMFKILHCPKKSQKWTVALIFIKKLLAYKAINKLVNKRIYKVLYIIETEFE